MPSLTNLIYLRALTGISICSAVVNRNFCFGSRRDAVLRKAALDASDPLGRNFRPPPLPFAKRVFSFLIPLAMSLSATAQ